MRDCAANGPHPIGPSDARAFGQQLERLRNQQGLSRAQLCERSGVSVAAIRRIELGTSPKLDTIQKLSDGLGLPLVAVIQPLDEPIEGGLRELFALLRRCEPRVIQLVIQLARVVLRDVGVTAETRP